MTSSNFPGGQYQSQTATQSGYGGGTFINGGNLVFSNVLYGTNFVVDNNSTLTIAVETGSNIVRSTNIILRGFITGNGNLVKLGQGGLLLQGNYGGTFVALTNGTISVMGGYIRGENGEGGVTAANKASVFVNTNAFYDIWDGNQYVDSISGNGVITKGWSSSTYTLYVGNNNGSGIFGGWISNNFQGLYGGASGGTMGLAKLGTGTQIFSGSNNASQVSVVAGTMVITNGGAINSQNVGLSTMSVANQNSLNVNSITNVAILNILNGAVVNPNAGPSLQLGGGTNYNDAM